MKGDLNKLQRELDDMQPPGRLEVWSQDLNNRDRFTCQETGQDMTRDQLDAYRASVGDNVTIIRILYSAQVDKLDT